MKEIKKTTSQKPINLHANHRQRMKDKFLKFGFEPFNDHEILEMLLYYALPQIDTNEIAHELINKAGSFANVFSLPMSELMTVKGIKENAATFLKILPEFARFYFVQQSQASNTNHMTYEEIGEYVVNHFVGVQKEILMGFYFDASMNLVGSSVINEGGAMFVKTEIRKIANEMLKVNGVNIVFAHNHPSMTVIPSSDDMDSTKRIEHFLLQLDIHLVEHFIVSGDSYMGILRFQEMAKSNHKNDYLDKF